MVYLPHGLCAHKEHQAAQQGLSLTAARPC
jgi:hypothetical protein